MKDQLSDLGKSKACNLVVGESQNYIAGTLPQVVRCGACSQARFVSTMTVDGGAVGC
jgi:hypothetical protein